MESLIPGLGGAALAFLASAAVLLVGRILGRSWTFAPAAIGLGYLAGHVAVLGRPAWPPAQAAEWLLPVALIAMLAGVVDSATRLPRAARWVLRLTVSAAMLGVTLRPLILSTWETREAAAWLIGLGAAAVAFWANLDALADRLPVASQPLSLATVAGIGAGAIFISGSFILGGLGMALAGAVAPVALLTLIVSPRLVVRGVAAAVAPVLFAIWLEGFSFAELPGASAALLMLSPAAAWVGWSGLSRRLGPRMLALSCAVATAIPAGVALGWAVVASPPIEAESCIPIRRVSSGRMFAETMRRDAGCAN